MESKVPNLSSRIAQIRVTFCENNNQLFAEKIGKSVQYASSICSGSKPVGRKVLDEILTSFPQVSKSWLYVGEGDMLTKETTEAVEKVREENSRAYAHTNTSISSDDVVIPSSVWNVIQQQAASMAAKDAQVDKLISIIEKEKTIQSVSLDSLLAPEEQLSK